MMLYKLPLPPSINRKYVSRTFVVSQEYRDYKDEAAMVFKSQFRRKPWAKEVQIALLCHFWFKRDRDIDSGLKVLLDTLEGVLYENDRQVVEIRMQKNLVKESPVAEPCVFLAYEPRFPDIKEAMDTDTGEFVLPGSSLDKLQGVDLDSLPF